MVSWEGEGRGYVLKYRVNVACLGCLWPAVKFSFFLRAPVICTHLEAGSGWPPGSDEVVARNL